MKMSKATYAVLTAAMRATVDSIGGPNVIRGDYERRGLSRERMLWDLWNLAAFDLMYDDTHPAFAIHKKHRAYPYVAGFDVYAGDLNDSHVTTALETFANTHGL